VPKLGDVAIDSSIYLEHHIYDCSYGGKAEGNILLLGSTQAADGAATGTEKVRHGSLYYVVSYGIDAQNPQLNSTKVEIDSISVNEALRKRRFGSFMLAHLLHFLTNHTNTDEISVRCTSATSVALFRKFGFESFEEKAGAWYIKRLAPSS
jgi:ribosomal protein S18 acetylase RimI-like enzyme